MLYCLVFNINFCFYYDRKANPSITDGDFYDVLRDLDIFLKGFMLGAASNRCESGIHKKRSVRDYAQKEAKSASPWSLSSIVDHLSRPSALPNAAHWGSVLLCWASLHSHMSAVRQGIARTMYHSEAFLLPLFNAAHSSNYTHLVLREAIDRFMMSTTMRGRLYYIPSIPHKRKCRNQPIDFIIENVNLILKTMLKNRALSVEVLRRASGSLSVIVAIVDMAQELFDFTYSNNRGSRLRVLDTDDVSLVAQSVAKHRVFVWDGQAPTGVYTWEGAHVDKSGVDPHWW